MYLGIMGWIGSILTIRGVTILSQARQTTVVPEEIQTTTVKEKQQAQKEEKPEKVEKPESQTKKPEAKPPETKPKETKPYEPEIVVLTRTDTTDATDGVKAATNSKRGKAKLIATSHFDYFACRRGTTMTVTTKIIEDCRIYLLDLSHNLLRISSLLYERHSIQPWAAADQYNRGE